MLPKTQTLMIEHWEEYKLFIFGCGVFIVTKVLHEEYYTKA